MKRCGFNRSLLMGVGAAALMTCAINLRAAEPATQPAATHPTPDWLAQLPDQPGLPPVLVMNDGTPVTTAEQWTRRREEMKQILIEDELGHSPPAPGNVKGHVLLSQIVLNGSANFRLVHLSFGPDEKLGIDIAIFKPKGPGPFPTIINPSFGGTPGKARPHNGPNDTPDNPICTGGTPTPATGPTASATTMPTTRRRGGFGGGAGGGGGLFGPVDPETAASRFQDQLSRGYAIVTYQYTQCGADNANFRSGTFFPAYPQYNWGVMAGWVWGMSRCIDYLETQDFADKSKLIVLGHSRLGKLTMIATAFDDRISLGAPAGSSGAGTGAYRFSGPGRGGKEGIEKMTSVFGYYWSPRFAEFTGHIQKLPFDAHWFIALAAPRPWISIEGTDDQNCVENAVKQSVLAAKPVYSFLGVGTDRVGVNYEPHRHMLTADDWTAAMDFADQQLRGIDHQRKFDQFP